MWRTPNPSPRPPSVTDPLTILLIDDDETVLESLRAQLRRGLGGQVLIDTATSGTEAVELAQEYVEDGVEVPVVICDEIMPGMRGHVALEAVHARLPSARTILLTGQADLASVTAAINRAGLYRYIAKPWEQTDLLLTVQSALDSWQADRDRLRRLDAFHAFVPEAFLGMLGVEDPADTTLGLSRRNDLTVLFADIRNFTSLSERLGSSGTFEFLNECFRQLVPIIANNGGVVDKYIGDAVLALFPDPSRAVSAAAALVATAPTIRTSLQGAGPIQLGVGVNTGSLILGTVGIPSRLQTTVIGDVVNTAARIEGLTKELCTPVLVAGSTASHSAAPMRAVGSYALRGKGHAVPIFQLLEPLAPAEREAVEAGRAQFQALIDRAAHVDLSETLQSLEGYLRAWPADQLAQALYHRQRNAPGRVS